MSTSGALFGSLEDNLNQHPGALVQFVQQCMSENRGSHYYQSDDASTTASAYHHSERWRPRRANRHRQFIHLAAGYNSGMDKQTELKKDRGRDGCERGVAASRYGEPCFWRRHINCQVMFIGEAPGGRKRPRATPVL